MLTTAGIDGATLKVVGYAEDDVKSAELPVAGDTVGSFRVYVTAPFASLESKATDLEFVLTNTETGEVIEHETLFAGPAR